MTWTSPVTVATGDIYTAAMFNTYTRDNTNHLRGLVGNADPGATGKALIAGSSTTGIWQPYVDSTIYTLFKTNAHAQVSSTFGALLGSNKNGFYNVVPATDGPVASQEYYCLHISEFNISSQYGFQLACNINDINQIYIRLIIAANPTSWFKLWHAGNDGISSELDADALRALIPGNANGQIPISNTILCTNLNAQFHAGLTAGNANGNIPISNGTLNTNLNAQFHAGLAAGNASGNIPINNGTVNANLNSALLNGFGWFTPVHILADAGLNPVNTTPTNISGLVHTATRTGTYLILWIVQWEIAGQLLQTSAPNFRTRASRSGSGTQESKDCISGSPAGAIFGQHGHGILTVNAGDTIRVRSLDPTAATSLSGIRGENSFMTVIWIGH